MPEHDIIVIGASAGGVETLTRLCRLLPGDLPASVFIVLHTAPNGPGLLPKILGRYSKLPVVFPGNHDPISRGKIYIAPPDQHLLIHPDRVELSSGPRENLLRPSIDKLFRSAAQAFGPRVIGVVLSGTRQDGTAGLQEIQRQGGVTMVQDPEEAIFPGMPKSAIENLNIDYVLPVEAITATLERLARDEHAKEPKLRRNKMANETPEQKRVIQQSKNEFELTPNESQQTILTCPECGGVLWEVHDGDLVRYACHIGHVYSENSLMVGHTEALEEALWVAVRSLEERVSMLKRLANRARRMEKELLYNRYMQQSDEAEKAARIVRAIASNGQVTNLIKDGSDLED